MEVDARAVVPSAVAILNVLSNVPAFVLLVSSRKLKEDIASRAFASLFLADLGMGGLGSTISAAIAWTGGAREGRETDLSPALTALHGCVFATTALTAVWHLALVSVIRCSVITRPLTYWTIFTPRLLRAVVATLWGGSILTVVVIECLGARWGFSPVTLTPFLYPSDNRSPFGVVYITLNLIVPGVVIVVAYTRIFLIVRSHMRTIHARHLGSLKLTLSSVRSAKNLFAMIAAYTVAYCPLLVMLVPLQFPPWYMFTATWLYHANSGLNSFLYVFLHRNVAAEYRKRLCGCCFERGSRSSGRNSVAGTDVPETVLTVRQSISKILPTPYRPPTIG